MPHGISLDFWITMRAIEWHTSPTAHPHSPPHWPETPTCLGMFGEQEIIHGSHDYFGIHCDYSLAYPI